MLIPTSNHLKATPDPRTQQSLNSLRIDFSRMAFAPLTSSTHYSQCQHCQAIPILEDKATPVEKTPKGDIIWTCRFCKKQNCTRQLYFVENGFKWCLQKGLKSKITPPILLFLIDNSGSMEQSIYSNIKFASNPNIIQQTRKTLLTKFSKLADMLKQSHLHAEQKKQLKKIQSNFHELVHNAKYAEQQISKLTFLYAMIEYNLRHMKVEEKNLTRVGFVFFSDMLYVLKAAKQKQVPVYVQQGELCHEEWPYRKTALDFDDYYQIYQQGASYEKYFGDSTLKQFKAEKVAVNKVKGGGRTALGPALAFAMGVISVHDQGSRIIVATDSQPNFGILSGGNTEPIYDRIGQCLSQNGATLSILKWNDQYLKSKEEESFNKFRLNYREYVEQIELSLARTKELEGIQLSMTALSKLMTRRPIGNSCSVSLYCDNPSINPTPLPIDPNDYSTLRFVSSGSRCWSTLHIKQSKLQEYNYLFPVFSQIVITYADIFTKQRYLFMSYTRHQLVREKPEQLKEHTEHFLDEEEEINMDNLNELCNLEVIRRYQQRKVGSESNSEQTSDVKTVFNYKEIQLYRQLSNMNDLAQLQHQRYHHPQSAEEQEQYEVL